MIFGGEESGGMIIGSNDEIKSLNNRMALSMRKKAQQKQLLQLQGLFQL